MLCKFDRSGVIPVRNGWPSIARMVRWPIEVVERAGPELVTDGRVRVTDHGFVAPNFTDAQTASKSDKLRQRESRDRRRDVALSKQPEITKTRHASSRKVTKRDGGSRDVTLPLLCSAEAPIAPAALPPAIATADAVTSFQPAVDNFHKLYLGAYGRKPTWNKATIGMMKALVDGNGVDEVNRRSDILFTSPPSWLKPPYDVATLVKHFDKLVQPAREERDPRVGRGAAEYAPGERERAEAENPLPPYMLVGGGT
jgi:hypothetical protein